MKTLLPIKSFEQFVIWLKTLRKVCTCDTLGLGLGLVTHLWSTLHMLPNILFLFLFQMFAAFQILETPTLFCVFVPFVFKLWLSGSILHLSSNLVAVTPSYQLQTCATQKCLLIKLSLNKVKCLQFWLITFDVINLWHSLRWCRNALFQQKGWLGIAKLKPLVERYSCQPMRRLDTSNNLSVGPSCMWRTWNQC